MIQQLILVIQYLVQCHAAGQTVQQCYTAALQVMGLIAMHFGQVPCMPGMPVVC